MKKNFCFKIIFLGIALLTTTAGFPADFYVSPDGDDAYAGTRDRPFATPGRAIEAAREFFSDSSGEDCYIWLEGGTFRISSPLILNAGIWQNGENALYVKRLPGEQPVISGGQPITGWEKQPGGLWEATLPGHLQDGWETRELFIDNRRAQRARFPNEGFLKVRQVGADRRTHFYFDEGDFPVPAKEDPTELILLHDWSVSRIGVQSIDEEENILTAVDSIGAKGLNFFNLDNWEKQPRYFLENSPVFLDADYEWIQDVQSGKILLQLPSGIHPGDLEIVVPVAEQIIVLQGEEDQKLENIHFEGITFRHSAWNIPEKGYCGIQACYYDSRPRKAEWEIVPAAVYGEWIEDCSFQDCHFEHLGTTGLWLGAGSTRCLVKNSVFNDISGNGIMIGEGYDRMVDGEKWWKAYPQQVAQGNVVENCRVTDCGQQFFGAVGIWCGLTAETLIRNNEVAHLPYTGVSVGWMWNTEPTPCRANIVEGNHIHHIMKVLSDGGGIYMLGLQPGSQLIDNHIHDVDINAGRAESNGMFLDQGATDLIIARNLIYNIAKSPLRFHLATTNLVKDNDLFCKEGIPAIRYNNTREEDIRKVNNRIYRENEDHFMRKKVELADKWNQKRTDN